jgi:hypothetical protein
MAACLLSAAAQVASAQEPVSGVYRANGQDARLAYATAIGHDDFDGKPAVIVVFTEKDPKGDASAHVRAAFGEYGSALIVTLVEDGSVIGCEVAHAALEHMGASSIGKLKTEDFTWSDGEVRGTLTTRGEVSLFDETWEVDLAFKVKLP